jgi:beta-mannosidase
MLDHQKNNEGNSIIHDYIAKEYHEPKDFASFLYVSQMLQAEGIKIGAEHFRRSRPETMGSIFWQLNDCWPVASWSSIDYDGRWKALQFYARRFYAPTLVSPHLEDGSVKVYVVSDRATPQSGQLHVTLEDFNGNVLTQQVLPVTVAPLSSKVYAVWPMQELLKKLGRDTLSDVFVHTELLVGDQTVSRNLIYLVPTKEVHLPRATLKTELTGVDGVYRLHITSPVLARGVYVSFGDKDAKLRDNYFDVIPGETVVLDVTSKAALRELREQMHVMSLIDAFDSSSDTTPPSSERKP